MISFASVFLSLYEMYSLVHKFIYRVYIYFCFVKGVFLSFYHIFVKRSVTCNDHLRFENI